MPQTMAVCGRVSMCLPYTFIYWATNLIGILHNGNLLRRLVLYTRKAKQCNDAAFIV